MTYCNRNLGIVPAIPGAVTAVAPILPKIPIIGGIFKKGLCPPELPGSYAKWCRRDSHMFNVGGRPVQVNYAGKWVAMEGRFPEGRSNDPAQGMWGERTFTNFTDLGTQRSKVPKDLEPTIMFIVRNRRPPAAAEPLPTVPGAPTAPGAPVVPTAAPPRAPMQAAVPLLIGAGLLLTMLTRKR